MTTKGKSKLGDSRLWIARMNGRAKKIYEYSFKLTKL